LVVTRLDSSERDADGVPWIGGCPAGPVCPWSVTAPDCTRTSLKPRRCPGR
jgi:hypothetical protein